MLEQKMTDGLFSFEGRSVVAELDSLVESGFGLGIRDTALMLLAASAALVNHPVIFEMLGVSGVIVGVGIQVIVMTIVFSTGGRKKLRSLCFRLPLGHFLLWSVVTAFGFLVAQLWAIWEMVPLTSAIF